MTTNTALGQFTPPMAVNLRMATRIANASMQFTARRVLWVPGATPIALVLIAVRPRFSLGLPQALGR